MNIVGRRQKRVELTGTEPSALCDSELGAGRVASIVEPLVDGFVLDASINTHETPGEVSVRISQ